MTRKRYLVPLVAAALLLIALLGPTEHLVENLREPKLPDDLRDFRVYLHDREEAVGDITPGTRKLVRFANLHFPEPTVYAVVYLHGFTATRRETEPVAEKLARALEANLFETRLSGHGRPAEALGEVTANDWLNDTVEAVRIGRRLGQRVVVIGVSTGATLAVWAAAQEDLADDIHALVLISPNFGPANPMARMLLWPWARAWVPLIQGPERTSEPTSEEHARYWTTTYPTDALFPMMALVQHVDRLDKDRIETPALFLYSPTDETVNPDLIVEAYENWGSPRKRLVEVENPGDDHVIAGDIRSPETTDFVAETMEAFIWGLEK